MLKIYLPLIAVLISWIDLFSQNSLQIEFSVRLFPKTEIRDSVYRQVIVYKKYLDPETSVVVTDTSYIVFYDPKGNIVYEKQMSGFDDSTIILYKYNDHNELLDFDRTHFVMGRKENRGMKYQYCNGNIVQEQMFFNGKASSVIKLFYDKKNRLYKEETNFNDSSGIMTSYQYNNADSLIKIISIEKYGSKSDSVITRFSYDSRGMLIEKSRKPSPTYLKTLGIDCSVGLYEYYRRDYDTNGKITFETQTSEEELSHISYAGRLYKRYFYFENGFICKHYDSNNQERGKDLYSSFAVNGQYGSSLMETYNTESKTTIYLSNKSKLPKSISYPGDTIEESTTYFFEYTR